MTRNNLISIAAFALCSGLFLPQALAKGSGIPWGSNSLSEEPRSSTSPPMVVGRQGGIPFSALDTVDSSPGFVKKWQKERIEARARAGWEEEETVFRSSAPGGYDSFAGSRDNRFINYGDDIAALSGIQLSLALNHLHHLNQSQIQLAKMAETKAHTPAVLTLAHQIRADHEKMEKKVSELADKRDVDLESFQLSTYEKVVRNRLRTLSGSEFERAFLKVVEKENELSTAEVEHLRFEVMDSEVDALAAELLPAIYAHQEGSVFQGKAAAEESGIGE